MNPMKPHASPRPDPSSDASIDAALAAATGPRSPGPTAEGPLKKLWDDELEAELEAALEGFDEENYDVGNTARSRAADRAHVPKGQVGQEGTPGLRTGKVIGTRGRQVFVDLGGKSEGVIPLDQFGADGPPPAGSMIEAVVDRFDEAEGLMLLSLKGAAVEADWTNLRRGLIVEARVTKVIKGGVEVDVDGIRGFLPLGQLDLGFVADPATYVNKKFKVVVTEARAREKNLVVSRRDQMEQERAEQRVKTWAELEEGQVRKGIVRSVKEGLGAFVDLGGVDGLIHISDLSWARTEKIDEMIRIGDEVEVKVLRVDKEAQRVGLGLKQLTASPWDRVDQNYARGTSVRGKVTRLMDFGAFVELEPGIEGLIHISELATKRVVRVRDVVQAGQEVEVRVLKVEADAKRISLSLRSDPAAVALLAADEDEENDDAPEPPKPERKVPLKGGLGDSDPDPFSPKPKS